MQKLVWQNANGDEIDLTSGNYGITQWEGFSNTSLNIQSQQVPFQDGAVFLDALLNQRELSVTLKMQDNGNLEDRYRMRRELVHILNPKLGEGYLIYTNDFISKRIKCVAQIPLFETHNSDTVGTPKASLSWTACEPYWEDLEETSISFKGSTTIINNGDVPTNVKIIAPSGVDNMFIKNITSNKIINLFGEVDVPITINTELGRKSLTGKNIDFIAVSTRSYYARICYGIGLFVISGGNGLITYDSLQNKYTYAKNIIGRRDCVYGNSCFVSVGESGTYTSIDGYNWVKTSDDMGYSIIYDGSRFLTISAYIDGISVSVDGYNWETITTQGITVSRTISYSAKLNKYILCSDKNIYYSSDLIDFSLAHTFNLTIESSLWCKELSLFVVVGQSGLIATSPDGVTWTTQTSGTSLQLEKIMNKSGVLYAVGDAGLLTSLDGVNWNFIIESADNSGFNDIIFAISQFIIVGDFSLMLTSLDGVTWEEVNNARYIYKSIAYGDKKYISVCEDYDVCMISKNGINWAFGGSITAKKVVYGNGKFIATNGTDSLFISENGDSWSVCLNALVADIEFINNKFIGVGNGIVYFSTDGVSWTSQSLVGITSAVCIAYGNNKYVAITSNNEIATSSDGINWTIQTVDIQVTLNSITYGNGKFIIVGNSGKILLSTDGIVWKYIYSSLRSNKNLNSICFGDNTFVAISNGEILVSTDGNVWTIYRNPPSNVSYKYVVIYGDGKFVTGNNYGIYNSSFEYENLINRLSINSDINMQLEIGENTLLYTDDSNDHDIILTYRQKYIGV